MSQVPAQRGILELISAQQPAIAMAIGGRTPEERTRRAERFVRISLTAVRKNPKLMACSPQSFLAALMVCAQLDLEPNTPQGLAYLIPYGKECQFQIGYKGLLQLAYRSGMVQSFNADVVYRREVEAGMFEYHKGINPSIRHDVNFLNPSLREGEIVAAYAACTLVGGQPLLRVIDSQDVARAKASSSGVAAAEKYGKQSPWQTHEAAMWMKTAIKRLAAWMPQTEMMALAVDNDDRSERGEALTTQVIEEQQPANGLAGLNNALQNYQTAPAIEPQPVEAYVEESEPAPAPAPNPEAPKAAAKRAPKAASKSAKVAQPQAAQPVQNQTEQGSLFDPRQQARARYEEQQVEQKPAPQQPRQVPLSVAWEDLQEETRATFEQASKAVNDFAKQNGCTFEDARAYFVEHPDVFRSMAFGAAQLQQPDLAEAL